MRDSLPSFLDVTIDFSQSHYYFPTIIIWAMGLMLLLIAVVYRKRLVEKLSNPAVELRFFEENADKFRLFATLILVVIYFWAMDEVGYMMPNTGYGFLICSVVFIFTLSTIYAHERSKRVMTIISANALIAPTVVWYVLGNLFDITLP